MKRLHDLLSLFYRSVFVIFLSVWIFCPLADAGTYKLVKDVSELIAGEHYLMAGTDGTKWYALGYQKTDNRHAVEVAVVNGVITTSAASSSKDQSSPYLLLLEGKTGGWMLKDEVNTTYLRPDKSGNKLLGNTSSVKWKIGISSSLTGDVSMECVESSYISKTSSKYLRFNLNLLFSCYSGLSTQESVYLFKEVKEDISMVVPPVFSLDGGNYVGEQTLSISSTEGTVVYYTVDGTEPSKVSSLYEHPLAITVSTTVKAIAYDGLGNASTVVVANYTLLNHTGQAQAYKRMFLETFDANAGEGGGDGLWSGMLWNSYAEACVDHSGWTFKPSGLAAYQCVLIGIRGESGQKASAETPELGISGKGVLRFKAGAWNTANEKHQLTLKIMGEGSFEDGTSAYLLDLKKGVFSEYEIPLGNLTEQSRISFVSAETTSSSDARFFLDEVELFQPLVEEGTSENIQALGGTWKLSELIDRLNLPVPGPESLCLELSMNSVSTLLSDFVVDNTSGSPNLLVYSKSPLTVLNALNVVDGVFQSEACITDLQPFHATRRISGPVSLSRSFAGVNADAGGWQSICLPFTVTSVRGNGAEYIPYSEWIRTMPKDKGFFWLKTVNNTVEKNDIDTDASQIEANKPYIIAFPNYGYPEYPLLNITTSTEFCFVGDGVQSTENLEAVSMRNWWFQSSYLAYTDENCYVLNAIGDRFERASIGSTVTSDPFRPYLQFKSGNGAFFSPAFIIGNDNAPASVSEISNLNGRCVIWTEGDQLVITSPNTEEIPIYTSRGELVIRAKLQVGRNAFSLPAGTYMVAGQKVVVR